MVDISLKDKSSQPKSEGSSKKCSSMEQKLWRSEMALQQNRSEFALYFTLTFPASSHFCRQEKGKFLKTSSYTFCYEDKSTSPKGPDIKGNKEFPSNQKNYLDLGGDASSVWNFCTHFSVIVLRGNQWWRRKMSAVFSS